MGMGVGEQVRKIELDAYQAFMKVTAVTGMSWVRARRRVAFSNPWDPRSERARIHFPRISKRRVVRVRGGAFRSSTLEDVAPQNADRRTHTRVPLSLTSSLSLGA